MLLIHVVVRTDINKDDRVRFERKHEPIRLRDTRGIEPSKLAMKRVSVRDCSSVSHDSFHHFLNFFFDFRMFTQKCAIHPNEVRGSQSAPHARFAAAVIARADGYSVTRPAL